jgi:hypothetical protein
MWLAIKDEVVDIHPFKIAVGCFSFNYRSFCLLQLVICCFADNESQKRKKAMGP